MPPGQTHPLPFLAGPADTRVSQAPAALGVQGGGHSAGCSHPRAHRCALQVRAFPSPKPMCVLHLGVNLQMLERKIPHVNAHELVLLWCRNPRARHLHSRVVNQQLLLWHQDGGITTVHTAL